MYPSEHNEVFERKIQQHEIVKSLRKSVVDLQLQICLTQSPAMIASVLSLKLCKKKKR